MVKSACLGFCRNNKTYDLIPAINNYLEGSIEETEFQNICKNIRKENWFIQKQCGIDIIPSNDFTIYDRILDATCLVGNIQRRFFWEGGKVPLHIYFTMAHGQQKDKFDVFPLELQNWLNTNYLYFVPEFVYPIEFEYSDNKPILEYLEAKMLGINTRSCIIGPISYLLLGKSKEPDIKPLELIDEILPIYEELFNNYKRIGVKEVQIEEPLFGIELDRELSNSFVYCYDKIRQYAGDINIGFVSYCADIHENFDLMNSLPVNSIHIDTFSNNEFLDEYCNKLSKDKQVSIGIVNARDVWINDLTKSIDIVSKFCDKIGDENVIISTSAPLTLSPYSVELETKLPIELQNKMSFAVEKLKELNIIKNAINKGVKSVEKEIKENTNNICNYNSDYYNFKKSVDNSKVQILKNKNSNKKWEDFLKANKIKSPATMFSGDNKYYSADFKQSENWYKIQENSGLDVVSASISVDNYDISIFEKKSKGVYVLKNNQIPRFLNNYYNPTIIYDYPSFDKEICVKSVNDLKKNIKKPIKFAICSPLHYLNFSFINPCLEYKKVRQKVFEEFEQIYNNISGIVDILQVNDLSFIKDKDFKMSTQINQLRYDFVELNKFFEKIKDLKCLALYTGYINLNNIIEEVCRLNVDILFTESARSGHEILQSFVSYKPQNCVGIGIFDTLDNRIPTKNEMYNAGKKMFMCFNNNQIILSGDGDFYFKKTPHDMNKIIKTLIDTAKDLRSFEK